MTSTDVDGVRGGSCSTPDWPGPRADTQAPVTMTFHRGQLLITWPTRTRGSRAVRWACHPPGLSTFDLGRHRGIFSTPTRAVPKSFSSGTGDARACVRLGGPQPPSC